MKKTISFSPLFIVLCTAVLLTGCYTTGGEDPPPVATIYSIRVEPEQIISTDTVSVTLSIKNLRDKSLIYKWRFKDVDGNKDDESTIGIVLNGIEIDQDNISITDSSTVLWIPNGFKGVALVQIVLEPVFTDFERVSTAITFNIE